MAAISTSSSIIVVDWTGGRAPSLLYTKWNVAVGTGVELVPVPVTIQSCVRQGPTLRSRRRPVEERTVEHWPKATATACWR